MANSTTKRATRTKPSSTSEQANVSAPATKGAQVGMVAKDVDPSMYVTVRNGFQGRLVYQSRKTGEMFVWDNFGDEQDMELRELKNAKNSYKKFFINNWFMFDDDWIVDYLGVRQFYKNAVSIDDFDKIFKQKPDELKKTISEMSEGQKQSVAYRARTLISNGEIDSLSVVSTLEELLGTELIEK